jgi:hypothetical protein
MSVERVLYGERNILTAADLNDEQDYLVRLSREHRLTAHGWGILMGLRLKAVWTDLVLLPGAAVDGYGRQLIVPEQLVIAESVFVQLYPKADVGSDRMVDFWLRYGRTPLYPHHPGMTPCGPGENSRWNEEAILCATRAVKDERGRWISVDPRRPPGVPADDLAQIPGQEPPDEPLRAWPVYLGRVKWVVKAGATPGKPTVQQTHKRPYAILVGEKVVSASRQFPPDDPKNPKPVPPPPVERAQMDLTSNLPGRPAFAIRVTDGQGSLVDRLAVSRSGKITLKGHTSLPSELQPEELAKAAALVDSKERKQVKDVCLGSKELCFSAEQIVKPQCMLSRLLGGQLPLTMEMQKLVYELYQEGRDEEEDPAIFLENLATFLADVILDRLVNSSKLSFDRERLQQIPLRSETWQAIRNWPPGQNYHPLNWQILAEMLADELAPGLAINRGHTLVVGKLAEPPKAARPWQIYRLEQEGEDGTISSQLFFEIADPGDKDDPTVYQLAIGGTYPASGGAKVSAFQPCLIVDAACNVTIKGDLNVEGRLVQSPVPADPDDPRFVGQLVQGWVQGAAAAELAATALQVVISEVNTVATKMEWSYKITVQNTSLVDIKGLEAIDTFAVSGVRYPTATWPVVAKLTPGESKELKITHTLNAALAKGNIVGLSLAVQGLAAGGMVVFKNLGDTYTVP